MRGEAQVYIAAPPEEVFRLISDVTRMGEWSPECRRCHEVMEGDWAPQGFMVAEFESLEQAKRWYNSPEYQAALPMRKNSTNSGLIMGAGM